MKTNLTRRSFLISALGAGVAIPGYARLMEAGWLEVTEKRVRLRGLQKPLLLLHLSDLHAGEDTPFAVIEEAVALGMAKKPDLVCLTGDYISRGRLPDSDGFRSLMKPLAGAAPAVASFGNHDGGQWSESQGGVREMSPMRKTLEASGICCLLNESAVVEASGQTLNLVGMGDLWADQVRPEAAFAGIATGQAPTILLSHNPDTAEQLKSYQWDLMLAGHTHGGQVVVPLLGIAPYVPVEDRRFIAGLCPLGERLVHVTRGVGSILGIRFGCRPEVSLLELLPA